MAPGCRHRVRQLPQVARSHPSSCHFPRRGLSIQSVRQTLPMERVVSVARNTGAVAPDSLGQPAWEVHRVSYLKSFTTSLIRSPLLWGGALAFCFFALIHGGVIKHAGTIRYLAGHWVEYVETVMFTVGLSALALKWLDVRRQAAHVDDPLLESIPTGGQQPDEATGLQAKLPEPEDDGYLVRRLREALELVVRTA